MGLVANSVNREHVAVWGKKHCQALTFDGKGRRTGSLAVDLSLDALQLSVMAVEQLLEGIAVARDVSGQQFGIAGFFLTFLSNLAPETHGRTVTNRWVSSTSPGRTDGSGRGLHRDRR